MPLRHLIPLRPQHNRHYVIVATLNVYWMRLRKLVYLARVHISSEVSHSSFYPLNRRWFSECLWGRNGPPNLPVGSVPATSLQVRAPGCTVRQQGPSQPPTLFPNRTLYCSSRRTANLKRERSLCHLKKNSVRIYLTKSGKRNSEVGRINKFIHNPTVKIPTPTNVFTFTIPQIFVLQINKLSIFCIPLFFFFWSNIILAFSINDCVIVHQVDKP